MSVEGRRRARWGAPESSAADLRAAAARAGRVTATHRQSNAIPREDHAARERGFSTCVTVDYRGGRAAGPSSAKKTTHDTRARASPASSRRTWRVVDPVNATTREPEPGRERDVRRTDARDEHPDDFESPDEDDEDEEEKTNSSGIVPGSRVDDSATAAFADDSEPRRSAAAVARLGASEYVSRAAPRGLARRAAARAGDVADSMSSPSGIEPAIVRTRARGL